MTDLTILGIDTSGKTASVAVCNEDTVLAQTTVFTKLTHSQVILPIVKDVLRSSELELNDIDAIAISKGPGSYTGLRIGISAVKAMCFALDKPCIGISTLESLAYNVQCFNGLICSVMSARADLMYCAFFESDGNSIRRLTEDVIINISEIAQKIVSENRNVILVGDGSSVLADNEILIGRKDVFFANPQFKLQLAASLCYCAFNKNEFISPDELNAEYLQITKAEKDIL